MTSPDRQRVAEYYSEMAATYHRQYTTDALEDPAEYPANYIRLQILLERLAGPPGRRLYEVGVGEGTPLVALAGLGLDVAGCDISDDMVELARRSLADAGLDPRRVVRADIEEPETLAPQLAAGPFDVVVAAGVLPHVADDEAFLERLKSIVSGGGKLFVEFRNSLFALFTFNRFTRDFILDELLSGVDERVRTVVASEIAGRLDLDKPPPTALTSGEPVLSRFHNPFELLATFARSGLQNAQVHWYHYHPAPPMLEGPLGELFRTEALSLEGERSGWRGMFLCSAGMIEADWVV